MLHALTGCDQVTFFAVRGKKTSWETLNQCEDVMPAVKSLCQAPAIVDMDERLLILEPYIVLHQD